MGFGDLSLARKRAIVDFLFRRPNVSLGEAATHFGLSWEALRDEVSQLSTVELVSGSFFESPFDVWIDDDVPTPIPLSAFLMWKLRECRHYRRLKSFRCWVRSIRRLLLQIVMTLRL